MRELLRKLGWLTQRRRKEEDLEEELRFHLEEEAGEHRAEGMAEREARWAARRGLGNVTLVGENTRAAWGWTLLDQLGQDLRFAFRTMASNRLFTALAVLSLALGIGANTAIYSFMDAILMRSLPVADPQSLVVMTWRAKGGDSRDFVMQRMSGTTWGDDKTEISRIVPYPAFELFRKNDAIFSSVFGYYQAWNTRSLNVAAQGHAEIASGVYVTGGFFQGLGLAPAAGRLLIPDDDRMGGAAVAVVSKPFSEKFFGGADKATGRPVLINSLPFTVVGVAPPGFFGIDPATAPDVYLPMHSNVYLGSIQAFGFSAEGYLDANYYWVEVMGRLRPGVSVAQAQAVLAPQFHQWVASTAKTDQERARLPALVVESAAGGLNNLRRKYSEPLFVLLTLVGLILAIACANVANLLLARAASRRREMALRISVGAGRMRLVRQLLTESVLLSSLAGVTGVALAIWGIRALTLLLANGQRNFSLHAELNWHVLAAAGALSLLTGVLFGLAPAIQSTRAGVMLSGSRHSLRSFGLSRVLVVAQIGFSLLMLVAAGLFVRTLSNLQSVELGFNRENLLLFQVDARKSGHKDPEIDLFYGDLGKRFAAIPGVRQASLAESSLVRAGTGLGITIGGKPVGRGNRILAVGPGFLSTMQVPILAGREIAERDHIGSPAVAVVNERFVKTNLEGRDPLGVHLVLWNDKNPARDMEIVGVAKDAIYGGLKEKIPPVVYIPFDQGYPPPNEMVYALRTAGDPLTHVAAVRGIVREVDARVPVTDVKTQAAEIDETINQEITFARLCTVFAILALAIACVGLYGTVSYNVARRTSEIGIRMALGAPRGVLVWMVLREVLMLALAGLAISVPAALGASKLLESFLFGMKANDPGAVASAVVILLGAAMLAGYLPARKASQVDPLIALRHE
jgi:macrolide transport system ATP-binding/permease protein